jgi:vacuolar protein sorting-associated protein 26
MASFFTFSQPLDIDIRLDGEDERKNVEIKGEKDRKESAPVYFDGESVRGQAIVRLRDNKVIKHDGIKVEFVGSIGACRSLSL